MGAEESLLDQFARGEISDEVLVERLEELDGEPRSQ